MRLFKRRPKATKKAAVDQAPRTLPQPEVPVQVIGDIHGMATLTDKLIEKLPDDAITITVGDYVDRGDDSAAVLRLLRERQKANPETFLCLMGNHEKMLLDFIDRPQERGGRWLKYGGLQTLASFGLGGVTENASPQDMVRIRDRFRDLLGPELEAWLRALPKVWNSANLWVVHAAASPGRPMSEQEDRVLLWGHPKFLSTPRPDGQWVVHGHTVTDLPEQRNSRIAIDTGAYFSGRLTAARILPNGEVDFVQAT